MVDHLKKGMNAIIYNNVQIGKNSVLEDYVVLGKSTKKDKKTNQLKIGDRAYLRTGTIIYEGSAIGRNFTTGDNARVRENTKIGNNVSLGANSSIERDCFVGNNVRIQTLCFIPEYTIIEDDVWIGPNVTMTNVVHPPCPIFKERAHEMELKCVRGPILKKGSIIGAGAILLPGIEVGERALVAAGSIVLTDVKKETVIAGIPAKKIKKINELTCDPGIFKKGEIYSWLR